MCVFMSQLLTYSEADLATSHHVVQEGVLSHQLQTWKHKDTISHAFRCLVKSMHQVAVTQKQTGEWCLLSGCACQPVSVILAHFLYFLPPLWNYIYIHLLAVIMSGEGMQIYFTSLHRLEDKSFPCVNSWTLQSSKQQGLGAGSTVHRKNR